MIRLVVAPLVLLLSAWGQVAVGVNPSSEKNVKAFLGSYANQHMTMWAVALRNDSKIKVSVSESAVLVLMAPSSPIPAKIASTWVNQSAKVSPWVVTAQLISDLAPLGIFLSTSGLVAMGDVATNSLAAFNEKAPWLAGRLRGQAIPAMANFLQLAWMSPVDLDPGAATITWIFTERQSTPHYQSFMLPLPGSPTLLLK